MRKTLRDISIAICFLVGWIFLFWMYHAIPGNEISTPFMHQEKSYSNRSNIDSFLNKKVFYTKALKGCQNNILSACIILLDVENKKDILKEIKKICSSKKDSGCGVVEVLENGDDKKIREKLAEIYSNRPIENFFDILIATALNINVKQEVVLSAVKKISTTNQIGIEDVVFGYLLLNSYQRHNQEEQLLNNAIAFFDKACKSNINFCVLPPFDIDDKDSQIKKEKKISIVSALCDGGNPFACNRIALLYEKGELVEKNIVKAVDYYIKSCNGGDAWGCYNLAASLEDGEITAQNKKRAKELYEKSCKLGLTYGCERYKNIDRTWADKFWYILYAPFFIPEMLIEVYEKKFQ